MATVVDMGIVLTALGAAAWYTGRVFWRARKGGSACRACPSASPKAHASPLVQLRRTRQR